MIRFSRHASAAWLLACLALLKAQNFDNSANGSLSGAYFVRELLLSDFSNNGSFARARSLSGTLTFDGAGKYTFDGQLADSSAPAAQAQPYTASGQYSVAPNGLALLWPLLDQNTTVEDRTIYGAVAQSVFIGSCTEGSVHDLVIAVPAASAASNASVLGTYSVGAIGFLQAQAAQAWDASFALVADGTGNFPSFNLDGSAANLGGGNLSQTITGATYSIGLSGAGTATFPAPQKDASAQLFSGDKTLYVSRDGSIILGGDPNGFEMFVGIRTIPFAANNATYQGTYFVAGLEDDASNLFAGQSNIDSYYGSTNAFGNGHAIDHLRLNSVLDGTYDYTYDTSYNVSPNGVINQSPFSYQLGVNGNALVVVGQGNEYHLSIGLHAPSYSASGVFLSPIGIVNAASLAPITNPVAPNELVTLYGSGLSPASLQAQSLPFPSNLGGVEVRVNDRPASVYYVSPTQISAIVPSATAEAYATFQVIVNGKRSNSVTLYTNNTAPGVFTLNQAGYGSGAILHADYSLVTAQNPAEIGETVLVFLTGLGATTPPIPDGAPGPTSPLSVVIDPMLQVIIDGQNAPVAFAGLAPGLAGLYQINVQVPSNVRSGSVYLDISTSSAYQSQSTLSIAELKP